MSKSSLAVQIGGKEYRVLSDGDDEAGLQEVAGYVDSAMRTIRERTGSVDSLDVAVLTALNFARELLAHRELEGERVAGSAVDVKRLHALIELAESAVAGVARKEASEAAAGALAAGS